MRIVKDSVSMAPIGQTVSFTQLSTNRMACYIMSRNKRVCIDVSATLERFSLKVILENCSWQARSQDF